MRILLADDDSKIHLIVRLWLSRKGHEVVSANNGREALAQVDQEEFDILISDVNMPLMNGVELVQKVLQHENSPGLIIMMTSRCDGNDLAKKLDPARVHLFSKPFSPADLADLVERLAAQKVQLADT